jgi:hypothetical protein
MWNNPFMKIDIRVSKDLRNWAPDHMESSHSANEETNIKIEYILSYVDTSGQYIGMNSLCKFISEQYPIADNDQNQV